MSRYRVPDWFLGNVKTVEELQAIQSNIWLADETKQGSGAKPAEAGDVPSQGLLPRPNENPTHSGPKIKSPDTTLITMLPQPEDDQSACYTITRKTYQDLLDGISLLQSDVILKRPNRRCTLAVYSQMRHGLPFLDGLVTRVARELQCSLISIHPYELEDIACELYDQEDAAVRHDGAVFSSGTSTEAFELTKRTFGAPSETNAGHVDTMRARDAVFAILDAVERKVVPKADNQQEDSTMGEATPTTSPIASKMHATPILLYFRDVLRILASDKTTGQRVLGRLRDAVNIRRHAGQNIVLVVGMTHTEMEDENGTPCPSTPWKFTKCPCAMCKCHSLSTCSYYYACQVSAPVRKLFATGRFNHVLMPLGVPRGWKEGLKAIHRGSLTATKLESFKHRLHVGLGAYPSSPPGLLKQDCDWLTLLPETLARWFALEVHTDENFDLALARIIGKCMRKRVLEFDDVKAIFFNMKGAETPQEMEISKEATRDSEDVNETPNESGDANEMSEESEDTNETPNESGDADEMPEESEDANETSDESGDENEMPEESEDANKMTGDSEDANEAPEDTKNATDGAKSSEEESARKAKEWEDKMRQIRQMTTTHEKNILPCLVNPATFGSDVGDVVLDRDVLANIKTLVDLSKIKPEAASRILISQIRTTGTLLYGPPGTGKTLLARSIAKTTGSNMLVISPASINNQWVGESEKAIKATFSLARKLFPCIIFIDEVDALFYRRQSDDKSWQRSSLTQFLQEMDGLTQEDKSPFVLAATNRPMDLDGAFLRRLPYKIPFGLPNDLSRAEILRGFLKEDDLDGVNIDRLAERTNGFSGSDLKSLCGQAVVAWAVEHLKSNEKSESPRVRLTNYHFGRALENLQPSVLPRDIDALGDFTRSFGSSALIRDFSTTKPSGIQPSTPPSQKFWQVGPAEEDPATLLEEPLSVINPPEGSLEKIRLAFNYAQLPTDTSIRLLKVRTLAGPSPRNLREPIRCSLVTADVADDFDYFALSYTWGDPRNLYTDEAPVFPPEAWAAPAFEIDCDGRPVSVATNLYTALVALRAGLGGGTYAARLGDEYRPRTADYFYLWVDALCINQDDLDEKGRQIPLMGRIYSKARATLMWLGGGESSAAIRGWAATWEKFGRVFDRIKASYDSETAFDKKRQAFEIADPKHYGELGLEPIGETELISWYLYISRAWFQRLWVVQEWALSVHCVFVCGDMTIQVTEFVETLKRYEACGWVEQVRRVVIKNLANHDTLVTPARDQHRSAGNTELTGPGLRKSKDVSRLFHARLNHEGIPRVSHSLSAICLLLLKKSTKFESKKHHQRYLDPMLCHINVSVSDFRSLKATDPRDKIYALHDVFNDEEGRAIYPAPNYKRGVRDVYTEAAGGLAGQVGLWLLAFRESRSDNPHDLPSWVPDFEQDDNHYFYQKSTMFMASTGLGIPRVELKPSHVIDVEGRKPSQVLNVLGVKGYCVAKVAHTQPYYDSDKLEGLILTLGRIPETSWIALPPIGQDYWPLSTDPPPPAYCPPESERTPQRRWEVYWRTLVRDTSRGKHPAPNSRGEGEMIRLQVRVHRILHYIVENEIRLLLKDTQNFDLISIRETVETGKVPYFMRSKFGGSSTAPWEDYDYDAALALLLDTHAAVAMLRGDLAFGSDQRPMPPCFANYKMMWCEILAIRDAGNDGQMMEKLGALMKSSHDSLVTTIEDNIPGGNPHDESLFVTNDGHLGRYKGEDVHVDDEIWVLAGLSLPVALRSLGEGRYTLSSCVYVHGIMHGEALPEGAKAVEIDLV